MTDPKNLLPGNVCLDSYGNVFVIEQIKYLCSTGKSCQVKPVIYGRALADDMHISAIDVTKLAEDLDEYSVNK